LVGKLHHVYVVVVAESRAQRSDGLGLVVLDTNQDLIRLHHVREDPRYRSIICGGALAHQRSSAVM
jgi:hypothetical protein